MAQPDDVDPNAAVSDHAVVRYLERVLGIDVDDLKAEIAEHCAAGLRLRAPYSLHGRHRYVIRNGRLVTILHRKEIL